jgi:hypothetical protein
LQQRGLPAAPLAHDAHAGSGSVPLSDGVGLYKELLHLGQEFLLGELLPLFPTDRELLEGF